MKIENSTIVDLASIFRLYGIAIAYQKERYKVHWPIFEESLVKGEIAENRQWKITEDGKILAVFATTFSDPDIWEEKNSDPSVYIHRIATDPEVRGKNLVAKIVAWAKSHAAENGKRYVRLDTVGENKKLIDHYCKNGFTFLGMTTLKNVEQLPAHYREDPVSLFELDLEQQND